jgi:hypothetical protein
MSISTTSHAIIDSSGNMKKTDLTSILCENQNKVTFIGSYPTTSKECRVCNPNNEMWIAIDYNTNKGISACLPQPIDIIIHNYMTIGNVIGFLGTLYGGYRFIKGVFGNRRNK